MIFLEKKGGMECPAKRYIISTTFFAYFYKKDERASCVYGVEWEKLMMMMMIDLAICFYML